MFSSVFKGQVTQLTSRFSHAVPLVVTRDKTVFLVQVLRYSPLRYLPQSEYRRVLTVSIIHRI